MWKMGQHFSHSFMKVTLQNLLFGSPYHNIISKFVENCFTDKLSLVDHLAITTFLVLPLLAPETGCFSEQPTFLEHS